MSSPVLRPDGTQIVPTAVCGGCVLHHPGTGFMQPSGDPFSGVVLVGEALGREEAQVGMPFVGASGFALSRLFKWVGLRREHFAVVNCVWCQPPDNNLKPFDQAPAYCAGHHLVPYVNKLKATFPQHTHWPAVTKEDANHHVAVIHEPVTWSPKQLVVLALGETAFRTLTGWTGIGDFRGYVFWSDLVQAWVVPTFHPAYLLRGNMNQMLWARWDLEKALALTQFAAGSVLPGRDLVPLVDPQLWVVDDFVGRYTQALAADPDLILTFDIENPGGVMVRIGFCFGDQPGQTLSLAWTSHYLPAIKLLMASFGPKAAWNKGHDIGALQAEGMTIFGTLHDTMNAWHALHSDLEKALVNVSTRYLPYVKPWKHLFKTDMGFYNGMDALSNWINHRGIIKDLQAAGLSHVYDDHMVAIDRITDRMSAIGLNIDQARKQQLSTEMGTVLAQLEAEMQTLVPRELRNISPKDGYVRAPADTTGKVTVEVVAEVKVCSICGAHNPLKAHFVDASRKKPAPCPGGEAVKQTRVVTRWADLLPFTPSPQQLLKYAHFKKHKTYKSWTTGNATMDDEALGKMMARHPEDQLYPLVLQHRDVQKEKSTYIDIPVVKRDDLWILCGFIFNHKPTTLRFGCENPNMQNWPRGASRPRSLVIARPGRVLWKRDYSAIEAVLVGYDAKLPTYIRMAKLGIHDWVHAFYLRHQAKLTTEEPQESWSDADLKQLFKAQKKQWNASREMCKRIVHLSNYLGTAARIFMSFPKEFGSEANCKQLQSFYFDLFPGIPKWHWDTCVRVEQTKYITNAFGYRHFFFAPIDYVKNPLGEWESKYGPDAKRLIAMGPQSNAAGIMKGSMLLLGADDLVGPTLRLTIHDELFGECYPQQLDAVQHRAGLVMERLLAEFPLPPEWGLGSHLSIGTEGAAGFRWSTMSEGLDQSEAELYSLAESL